MHIHCRPRTPRDFGRLLHAMTVLNLPANTPPKGATKYLANLLGIDPSAVSAWMRGDLRENKPLRIENFQKIVRYFLGKPNGLHSLSDALEFANAAGEEYVFALQRNAFLDSLANQSRPVAHEQKTKQTCHLPAFEVSRTDLIRRVHKMARRCQALGSPLVLLGAAGMGNTTLLQQIGHDQWINNMYPRPFLSANLNGISIDTTLLTWLEETGLGFSPLARGRRFPCCTITETSERPETVTAAG